MEKIIRLIEEIAIEQISYIEKHGYAQPGNNGPYNDLDTPVRNTAHWIMNYSMLSKLTNKDFTRIITILANYLVDVQNKSSSGAIECRNRKNENHINGLIGQAWVIEALVEAYALSNNHNYLNTAISIYKSQKYDYSQGLWVMVDIDNQVFGYDYAYNHNSWFAYVGSKIIEYINDSEIEAQITDFLQDKKRHFRVYGNGRIKHYINIPFKEQNKFRFKCMKFKEFITEKYFDFKAYICNDDVRGRKYAYEDGYDLFDLYSLVYLYKKFPNAKIFQTNKFERSIKYGLDIVNLSEKLYNKTTKNINDYGYPYNSPAFEYPFIEYMLTGKIDEKMCEYLFNIQIEITYDSNRKTFSKGTNDGLTLTARMYELLNALLLEKNKRFSFRESIKNQEDSYVK